MIRKLSAIFNRKQKMYLMILAFMILLGALLELIGVSAILPVANVMLDPNVLETNEIYKFISNVTGIKDVRGFIVLLCVAIILVYIIKNAYLSFLYYIQTRFTQNNSMRLSVALLNNYLHRDYLYHTEHNISEMQRNIIREVENFFGLVETMIQFVIEIVTSLALLIYIFVTDWQTTLMMVALIGIPIGTSVLYFKKKLYRIGQIGREYNIVSMKWLLQALGGVKEIKATNREDFFDSNFMDARQKEIGMQIKSMVIKKVPRYVVEACCIGGMMVIVIVNILSGIDLALFANTLVVIALSAARLMPAFNRITEYTGTIMYRMPSLDVIYEDVVMLNNGYEDCGTSTERLILDKQISIDKLSFRYPEAEDNVFENLSFSIKKNTSVALIGPSGSGKTTLADVLLGLLKPTTGSICVDSTNIFGDLPKWRNSISYIPQTIYLTDDSIRNNIAFGQPEDEIDEEKIWSVLQQASLDVFVRNLPEGINTIVGDRGVRLSGGQRQRIGIARALYREPVVLLMDEATSALDQETESAIMESIENLHGAVTMIIIAHRLTTIQKCDEIYELKEGVLRLKSKEEIWG